MEPNHNGLTLSRVGKTFRAGTRHARTALEDVSLQLAPVAAGRELQVVVAAEQGGGADLGARSGAEFVLLTRVELHLDQS